MGNNQKLFYAHLDVCQRCNNEPFNLCGLGQILIQKAGKEAADELAGKRPSQEVQHG